MPFLRSAVYEHLLRAENLVAGKRVKPSRTIEDFDLDGRPEVKLGNGRLSAYLKPDRGGALYELDHHEKTINLTAVMTRREEAYHTRLVQAVRAAQGVENQTESAASIHERVKWKEPGLEKLLFYDPWPRDSLVDHFYPVGTTPDALRQCQVGDWGDFAGRPYKVHSPRGRTGVVTLERTGLAGPPENPVPVTILKRIVLGGESALEIRYVLQFPEGAPAHTLFAVEFNLTLSAADAPDRNFFSHQGENLNNLTTTLHRLDEPALGMVDEWLGLELRLQADPPAGFWTHRVETVNDSEDGFERIHQGAAVFPHWRLAAEPGEEQIITLVLEARSR